MEHTNFIFSGHAPQYASDFPFDVLQKKLGNDVVNIVKKLISYNIENVKQCRGDVCENKLWKSSAFNYCKKCYNSMVDEGFIFVKCCNEIENYCQCYVDYEEDEEDIHDIVSW